MGPRRKGRISWPSDRNATAFAKAQVERYGLAILAVAVFAATGCQSALIGSGDKGERRASSPVGFEALHGSPDVPPDKLHVRFLPTSATFYYRGGVVISKIEISAYPQQKPLVLEGMTPHVMREVPVKVGCSAQLNVYVPSGIIRASVNTCKDANLAIPLRTELLDGLPPPGVMYVPQPQIGVVWELEPEPTRVWYEQNLCGSGDNPGECRAPPKIFHPLQPPQYEPQPEPMACDPRVSAMCGGEPPVSRPAGNEPIESSNVRRIVPSISEPPRSRSSHIIAAAAGGKPIAASTCQYGDDEICRQVGQLLKARPWADAFIVSPTSVTLGNSFRLDLVVDPTKRTTKTGLHSDNPGKQVRRRSVQWTYTMRAEIEPGPSFEATPQFSNPVKQVAETGPTTWSWKIKGVQGGDADPIVVRLKAIFIVDGKAGEPVEVDVLKQPVVVNVPWWNGPLEWAERLGPLKELGGGALLVFVGGGIWRWWTKRKRPRRPRRKKAAAAAA